MAKGDIGIIYFRISLWQRHRSIAGVKAESDWFHIHAEADLHYRVRFSGGRKFEFEGKMQVLQEKEDGKRIFA